MAIKSKDVYKKVIKNWLLFMSVTFFFVACSDEKKYSNDEAYTLDHNMEGKQKLVTGE